MRPVVLFLLMAALALALAGPGVGSASDGQRWDSFHWDNYKWDSYQWDYFEQPVPRSYFWEHPPARPDYNRLPAPGLLPHGETLAVTLHQIMPFDGARFPRDSMITFGWLPMDDPMFEQFPQSTPREPIRYIVEIQRQDRALFALPQLHYPHKRYYTLLWKAPSPGRYVWWVRAQYDRNWEIPSLKRYFVVLP